MPKLAALLVLCVGVVLVAPLVMFVGFVARNYSTGFWVESDWKLVLGGVCAVLGIAAIGWSVAKLFGRARG